MSATGSLFHHRVYDVLVRVCGATDDESNRAQWDHFWMSDGDEYRFIGWFGFGGKFHRSRTKWYVTYYPENETPLRREYMNRANGALEVMREAWLEDAVGVLEG